MAESTKEKTNSRHMEDPTEVLFENSRRGFLGMMELNRNNMNAGYQFMREVHEEGLRYTDAWLDQWVRLQKNYLKSFNICHEELHRQTEKAFKSNQEIFEETVDRSIELVSAGSRNAVRR